MAPIAGPEPSAVSRPHGGANRTAVLVVRDRLTRRASQAVAALAFVAVVFGPVLALAPGALASATRHPGDLLSLAVPSGRLAGLLAHSLGLAAAVALSAMGVGVLVAIPLHGLSGRAKSWLVPSLVAFALVPPLVYVMVWQQAGFAAAGWLQSRGLAALPAQGWGWAWYVQTLSLTPLAVGLALVGLESVDPALVDAARVSSSDQRVLVHVVLPLAGPFVAAGAGLLFVLSLMDYSVPSLFSVNVYSIEVLAEYSASNDPARALATAAPLIVAGMLVMLGAQSVIRQAASSRTHRRGRSGGPLVLTAWLEAAQWVAVVVVAGQLAATLGGATFMAGSPEQLGASVAGARRELACTALTAASAAALVVPIAFVAARGMAGRGCSGHAWRLAVSLPLALPAPVVGIGLATLAAGSGLAALRGGPWLPALAAASRFAPFAAFAALAQLRRVDPLSLDAARVLHTSAWRTTTRVLLPLLAPGVLAAAASPSPSRPPSWGPRCWWRRPAGRRSLCASTTICTTAGRLRSRACACSSPAWPSLRARWRHGRSRAGRAPWRADGQPAPGVPHVIELIGVSKRFGQAVALANVALSVTAGERVAILGPSGSGKTTATFAS